MEDPKFKALPPDEQRKAVLTLLARHLDDPKGFACFYELIFGNRLPEHAKAWVDGVYNAKAKGRGVVIQAFRGSTKTTTLTIAFTAFRIGKEPACSNLLIQVGDDIALDNTEAIADIIANNEGFKAVFPHVEPDRDKGWGAGGYEVKRNDMEYGKWRAMNADRKDPTLIGLGYKSRAIIGKHPSGVLIVDDIHDENNTFSEREMAKVNKILTGTIFPTITDSTWVVFVGTPWVRNDTLGYLASTGEFDLVKTPIYDKDGKSVWPQQFTPSVIEKQKKIAGTIEFARMFLLDLEAASGQNLRREWLHAYPANEIGTTWPVNIGVDYASTADKLKDKERDYFTIAITRDIPGGGSVLVGGIRKHLSQGEAEEQIKSVAGMYPTLKMIGVEAIGKGEEFYYLLLRNTSLPIRPVKHGRKSKGERFQRQMAPLFMSGRMWVTDQHDEFIKHFIDEWLTFPNGEHDDCLDAVYMAMACSKGALMPPMEKDDLPPIKRIKQENPYAQLGRA